jgi:hypothetical protein
MYEHRRRTSGLAAQLLACQTIPHWRPGPNHASSQMMQQRLLLQHDSSADDKHLLHSLQTISASSAT